MLFIGADHAGFSLKEKMKKYFDSEGIEYRDLSVLYKPGDDYPKYAFDLGKKVSSNHFAKGILFCGSGNGMAVAANKVRGVRASIANDSYSAKMSRIDNDSNVLALGARKLNFNQAKKIIDVWLKTEFSGKERHRRRINQIRNYEK